MTTQLRGAHITQLHSSVVDARGAFVDVVGNQRPTFGDDRTVTLLYPELLDEGQLPDVKPTIRAHRQLAGRADVPTKYYERILNHHPDLWAETMNTLYPDGPGLYRMRRDGTDMVLRAALSDRYQVIDNVDVLTTMLQAFTDAGLGANEVSIDGDLDVDDGLLRIRCTVPSIGVNARELVKDYRSPFDRRTGVDLPMIFAGIEVSNSETGGGAYTVRPRAVLQVCNNGMTRNVRDDIFRKVHLGSRLTEGVISWSDTTRSKQLEFMSSAARDAISTFISPSYLRKIVDEASAAAGVRIDNIDESFNRVVKMAQLSDDEANSVMSAFITSADVSVLGMAQAVTAAAQLVDSSDRQSEMEQAFWSIIDQAHVVAAA